MQCPVFEQCPRIRQFACLISRHDDARHAESSCKSMRYELAWLVQYP
jgi:hypothetical protein